MFNHLNVNSRQVVFSLCDGKAAKIGKKDIVAFEEQSKRLLAVLSINLNQLRTSTGQDLVNKVIALNSGFNFEDILDQISKFGSKQEVEHAKGYRLGKVKTCSFRGLAPADKEWEYDFEGKSHLIYGPNGCGKSSLLGAICWCLTGKLFRDDCPPCEPEKITAYPAEGENVARIERDDAQALIDKSNNSSLPSTSYWVEIQLISNNSDGKKERIYLKRNSTDGLSFCNDGNNWQLIKNTGEAGIDELDAELHLLMPAKVSHLRFGKNPELIRLLAEIIGYGDLETITEVAEDFCRESRKDTTRLRKSELKPKEEEIQNAINKIKENENVLKELPSYKNICSDSRTTQNVKEFKKAINEQIETSKTQLAIDLELEIPDKKAEDKYKEWQDKSDNLPGQISNILTEISKPLKETFCNSIGLEIPSKTEVETTVKKLKAFEKLAEEKIRERLDWLKREQEQEKSELMLKSAKYFDEALNICPVCTQSLEKVPNITKELRELKILSSKEHLQQKLRDFVRYLESELNKIIPLEKQVEGEKSFSSRIKSDWENFKKIYCKELLLLIAARFDNQIKSVADKIQQSSIASFKLSYEGEDKSELCELFSTFSKALENAKNYVELCKCIDSNKDNIVTELGYLLTYPKQGSGKNALKEILERASSSNKTLKDLLMIQTEAENLRLSTEKAEEIKNRIATLTNLANSAGPIKNMKVSIRDEVKNMVKGDLGKKTKEYYEKLYDKEVLVFEQLTTGHPANPDIKDEINLYLKAGNHQVPMGPYSNAGRTRALLLSFAFALLEKTSGSIGFIILDDPALSLDDQHKARLVRNIISELLKNKQVFLATHYENFYKKAEHVFANYEQLKMPPRRTSCQSVCFEPGDLLQRVEEQLDKQTFSWREAAPNMRMWIERSIKTLSMYLYCLISFSFFNS
jgi:recombinational DNA repair ATPase RecF